MAKRRRGHRSWGAAAAVAVTAGLLSSTPSAEAESLSPPPTDESWIAFDHEGSILVMHPDGRGRRVVVARPAKDGVSDWSYAEPDLSSDGSRIVFTAFNRENVHDRRLMIVDTTGANLHDVRPDDGLDAPLYAPVWSPDGRSLAYVRVVPEAGAVVLIARDDGSNGRLVMPGYAVDWSPEGRRLLVTKPRELVVHHLDDGREQVISRYGDRGVWSPDGQRIAFTRTTPESQRDFVYQYLVVANADGSGQRDVFYGRVTKSAWSPDSRTLAISKLRGTSITLVDLNGATVRELPDAGGPSWASPAGVVPCRTGSWLAARDGGVFSFGAVHFHGSLGGVRLHRPVVHMAATSSGNGYWLVGGDGGIFTFGDAQFFGSTGGTRLNAGVLGMAATPTDGGYWLVAGDGGIFTFGDAQFFGSTGGMRLVRPVIAMVPTPSGRGYWLVARDGGVFTFGDAGFFGSTGGTQLAAPIVGIVPTPSGKGYWLVGQDGGTFSFGDAVFPGSASSPGLGSPVVATTATPGGRGMLMATADGQVVPFGDAEFCGSRYGFGESMVGVAAA